MPMGVELLVRIPNPVDQKRLEVVRAEIMTANDLDPDDYYLWSPMEFIPDRSKGFIPIEDDAHSWYDVGLWDAYWAPEYPRGDLPLFVRVSQWIEQKIPGCEIWYGMDGGGDEDSVLFDATRRAEMLKLYEKYLEECRAKFPEA